MDPTISPSCATWLSMSCERTTPSLPCVESSSSQAGMTNTWPSLSLNFEMRLPCGGTPFVVTCLAPARGRATKIRPATLPADTTSWRDVRSVSEIHETRKNRLVRKLRRRQPWQRKYSTGGHRTDSAALAWCTIAVLLHEPPGCANTPQHRSLSLRSIRQDCRRGVRLARAARSLGA